MKGLEMEFAHLIGSRLTAVWVTVHVEEGELDERPLGIWLEFGGKHLIGFRGTPDGDGLTLVDEPPRPQDMGEAGEVIVRDLAPQSPFVRAVGLPLRAVWELGTTGSTTPLGFRFDFGGLIRPMVLNWGDQIEMRLTLPPDARAEEIHEVPVAGSASTPG
jgi:hypothetical protein